MRTEKEKEQRKKYKQTHKDVVRACRKRYNEKHKEKIAKSKRAWKRNKMLTDPNYKFQVKIRRKIRASFRSFNFHKTSKTADIIGCSLEMFRTYLEGKFEPWMNWNNYGKYDGKEKTGWDLDHIIPTCSASTIEALITLNHYSNIQPLCSYINRIVKRDRLDWIKKSF